MTAPSGAPVLGSRARPGRYGLEQVVRSEMVKITTLRSTLWTALISVAGMALVTTISTHSALHQGRGRYPGFDPTNRSLAGVSVGVLTMGVFGVLVLTGEYASGTIRTSLSALPRRPLLLAGKALVAGSAMLVFCEALSFACFALGQAVLSGGGAPTADLAQSGVARAVVLTGVFLALFGMLGLGIGALIRNTAGAISAYVGVTFLLPTLLNQLSGDPARYTPIELLANSVTVTGPPHGQVPPAVALLLMAAYTLAVLGAGAVLFASRDA